MTELALPPVNPDIRIPLSGAVELVFDEAEGMAEGDPEERVEAFLTVNAEIFSAEQGAWATVKDSHNAYQGKIDELRGAGGGQKPSRPDRRNFEAIARNLLNANTTFGTCKHQAQEMYPVMRGKLSKEKPLEDSNEAFVLKLKEAWDDLDKHVSEAMEKQKLPERTHEKMMDLNRKKFTIIMANMYALYRQEIALGKLRTFLDDPAVVPAFTARLQELAQSKEPVREYPGLLELVAAHVEQEPRDNMLWAGIQKGAPEPTAYAREFWGEAWAKRDLPKELTAALGVMEIAADLVEGELSYDREAFMGLFANEAHRWPPELATKLMEFANSKTVETWTAIQEALKPYVRTGRLPVSATTKNVAKAKQKRGATGRDLGKPTSGSGSSKKVASVLVGVAHKGGEYGDVLLDDAETEREPISHFALLTPKGDKAYKLFTLDNSVANLEDVFEFSNFRAYVERHQHDKTVEPMLRAALEHLTRKPKDPACTMRLRLGRYELVGAEGDARERSAWRFSPQHFKVEGTKKGEIATKTRIFYDIMNYEGHSTLIIYGAFLKGDAESWTGKGLPRIR